MAEPLSVLSVRQPYAWAICAGAKTVENRSRATKHRGPLVIHASASKQTVQAVAKDHVKLDKSLFPYGAIIGIADVIDVVPMNPELEKNPWASGPWCWRLAKARVFPEPIPYKGKLGVYKLEEALAARVRAQIARARPAAIDAPAKAWIDALESDRTPAIDLARTYWTLDDNENMLRAASAAIDADARDGNAFVLRAVANLNLEKNDDAVKDATLALEAAGADRAWTLFVRSRALAALGKSARAEKDRAEALALDPTLAEIESGDDGDEDDEGDDAAE